MEASAWVSVGSPLVALVGMLVYLNRVVASGALVPRATVDFMRELYEARLQSKADERDRAIEVARAATELNKALVPQVEAVAAGQETIVALVQALPRPAPPAQTGGTDVRVG